MIIEDIFETDNDDYLEPRLVKSSFIGNFVEYEKYINKNKIYGFLIMSTKLTYLADFINNLKDKNNPCNDFW